MRHEIQIEQITRNADGQVFVRVIMRELAGVDRFEIVCRGETYESALIELAHRLRLAAADASDIAGRLFDRYWKVPKEVANSSSRHPVLRLVECGEEDGDSEEVGGDEQG